MSERYARAERRSCQVPRIRLLVPDLETQGTHNPVAACRQQMAPRPKVAVDEGVAERKRCACRRDLSRCTCRSRCGVGRCEFSARLLSGMIFRDATGVLGETARRLYPGLTRTGASGARGVGRPSYLMSCELALLSGRLCDLPGCAVSADP